MLVVPILYSPNMADNYAYYMQTNFGSLLVDAGDYKEISSFLDARKHTVDYILLTHEHQDHIRDVELLKEHYGAKIIAHHTLKPDLDQDDAQELGLHYINLPGHTEISGLWIAHDAHRNAAIFAGDVIFSCGSGRQFQGIDGRLLHAMGVIAALDDDYLLCTGHEYTAQNIDFCLQYFPEDAALLNYAQEVSALRKAGKPTMPIKLGKEKTINPFLRFHEKAILKQLNVTNAEEFLIKLRTLRDDF